MKKAVALLGFFALLASGSPLVANAFELDAQGVQQISNASLALPFDVINWKVGDKLDYQVSMGFFGKVGTSNKEVTKDEGETVWMTQTIVIQVANQTEKVEAQIRKSDGKVLKMIRNGKEEAMPDDKLEVISQEYTTITVPAGEFKVLHIVAKTEKVSKIEVWANPQALPIDGSAKQVVASQLGEIKMELTSSARGQ